MDASQLTGNAPYRVHVRMISQMVPVNLMHEISGVGFDYSMSPREVAYRVANGARILWDKNVLLDAPEKHIDWTPSEAEIMAPPAVRPPLPRDPVNRFATNP